ncbi:MAG: TetR family transcriptional regulator C-terminal domain-containing protein [Propionibacteriaceae bacterium]
MPKVVDVEQKRTELAFAAWAVIADRGLSAVTFRAVAAEAGVSLGAVQHYFATKEALLLYACQRMADLAGAQWSATSSGADARAQLAALAHTSLTDHPLQRVGIAAWNAFVGAAAGDPAMARVVQEVWSGAHRQATALWTAALASPGRRGGSSDPSTVAELFQALLDGLSVRVFAGRLGFEQARALAEQFLDDYLGPATA